MIRQWCFAYGSNLLKQHREDFFLKERGCNGDFFLGEGTYAILPDHRLVFNRFSKERWKGGVLSVERQLGAAVDGRIFEVSDPELLALKEGAGKAYTQRTVVVLVAGNPTAVEAFIAIGNANYYKPSHEYLEICIQGRRELGLQTSGLKGAADDLPEESLLKKLFIYGTLMSNEDRNHLLEECGGAQSCQRARMRGVLYDLGYFPGLQIQGENQSTVSGELIEFSDIQRALKLLDSVEGFKSYTSRKNLYLRNMSICDTESNQQELAWVYTPQEVFEDAKIIECGDWKSYRGAR